ncbi:uncharacterized protein LOC109707366 [Ananas comosus]|uniref:Uncharacterized protein LOC109707366 n=1 Tax=Ananas comosus TaxID=4615 RepID=A0A6P5EKT7_ANACO|nr:uncharacterized protein LOC109707366 [Ananas comosus]
MAKSIIIYGLLITFLLLTPTHHLMLVNGRIQMRNVPMESILEDLENCHKIDPRLWAPDTDFSKLRLWDRPEVGDRAAYFAYIQQKLRVPEEIQSICHLSKGVYSIRSRPLRRKRNVTSQGVIFIQSTELMMQIETPPHYSAGESWEYAGSEIMVRREPHESDCRVKTLRRMNCFERELYRAMLSEPSIQLDEFSKGMKRGSIWLVH